MERSSNPAPPALRSDSMADSQTVQQVRDLVKRLTEATNALDDAAPDTGYRPTSDPLSVAESSFEHVVSARDHLQDMAGRILTAIAFFSAAATAVYARVSASTVEEGDVARSLRSELAGSIPDETLRRTAAVIASDLGSLGSYTSVLPTIAFFGFMVSVLAGAVLYMAALWPANFQPGKRPKPTSRPEGWRVISHWLGFHAYTEDDVRPDPHGPEELQRSHSLVFPRELAERVKKQASWETFGVGSNPREQFEKEQMDRYLDERWHLARNAEAASRYLKCGVTFFVAAFYFFVFLVSLLFLPDLLVVGAAASWGAAVLSMTLMMANRIRPPRPGLAAHLAWLLLSVAFSIGGIWSSVLLVCRALSG